MWSASQRPLRTEALVSMSPYHSQVGHSTLSGRNCQLRKVTEASRRYPSS